MRISIPLFAGIVVTTIGALILWANPRRAVNRAILICSCVVAGWLVFLHLGVIAPPDQGLIWLRWTCSLGALVSLTLWLVKESIVTTVSFWDPRWLLRNAGWILCPLLVSILPFTEWFIPAYSTETQRLRGWAYYGYYVALVGYYGLLTRAAVADLGTVTGARRQELLVWLGGGCLVAISIYFLIGVSAVTHDPFYRQLQPIAVLIFYAVTGYAITSHRMFDARQILLVGVQKVTLLVLLGLAAYILNAFFTMVTSPALALIVTVMLVLWFSTKLSSWLDGKFQFLPQGLAARQAAFATAQRETRLDALDTSFRSLLKAWGQAEQAILLFGTKDLLAGGGIELAGDNAVVEAMKQLRWATPERLSRERATVGRVAIGEFLDKHKLAALVFEEGPVLSLIIGIGVGVTRRPFTYPQVTQLMELASIMESAIERAHFSAKAQHTEQLATVGLLGASIAHEIRNPLVSIKTFVQLLPTHHQDPAFREKFFRLIGDEVSRIDQLTEQLLDLASPRTYSVQQVELHPVLRTSLDLVAAKAAHKNIEFFTEFRATPDVAYTDASAARQVMLNLCFNAIQAVEANGHGARWVKIATRNTENGIEMAVADSGPGISEDIRTRLFQPFHTTKSTGFGLGLAICSDILANLDASISVDPPTPGAGATFRVIFPCQPLSS